MSITDFMQKSKAQMERHAKAPTEEHIAKTAKSAKTAAPAEEFKTVPDAVEAPKVPKASKPTKTSISLANQVAANNRTAPHLRGIRIKDGHVSAANLTNQILIKNAINPEIDAFVDADSFLKAWTGIKAPVLTQTEALLTVKSETGKSKVDLMFMDKRSVEQILGTKDGDTISVDPQGLLEAAKRLIPFLKLTKTHIWIYEGYLYVIDKIFMVRTPVDADMPAEVSDKAKPITLSQELVDLIKNVPSKPTSIKIGKDIIIIDFEDCQIKSVRYGVAPVGALDQFENFFPKETEELPEEVVSSLKSMIGFSDKVDTVSFGPMGISLMKAGKASWSIAHPMPPMQFNAQNLKHVLENGSKFNFTNPTWIAFKTADIEGIWIGLMTPTEGNDDEEQEEEQYSDEPEEFEEETEDDNNEEQE